jgi:hypothetical protein
LFLEGLPSVEDLCRQNALESLRLGVPVLPSLKHYSISTWWDFSYLRFHTGAYVEEAVRRLYGGVCEDDGSIFRIAVDNGQFAVAFDCVIVIRFISIGRTTLRLRRWRSIARIDGPR